MEFKSYIGGALIEGRGDVVEIVNPGTEETVATLSLISKEQAEETILKAQEGYEYWSKLSISEREKWIRKLKGAIGDNKDNIVNLLMNETGKLYSMAVEDYQMLLDCLEYFIEEAKRLNGEVIQDFSGTNWHLINRQPIGVVVGYLAWNFPLLNVGYKLGPALASGCSCVLKPSELAPLATLEIGRIAHEIGFPKGVINIVAGHSYDLAPVFNKSEITKMITLIGSSDTGKRVLMQSSNSIKHYSLELGGNAPVLVLKDYDEKEAAKIVTNFKFANCGQVCVSPNRVFVHESQYDSFVEESLRIANEMKAGWGKEEDDGAKISPIMTKKDKDRILLIIDDANKKGARIVSGGREPNNKEKGYYLEPTVIADVTKDMRCYREELFGPVMPIIKYSDSDDLVELGNDTEYGLASYIFSNDINMIYKISQGLKFGTVCVNEPYYSYHLPHGGVKESGVGKDCSRYSLEEYYYIKRISIAIK